MKQQIILWLAAIVITFLTGYLRNVTDKDFPITSTFGIDGEKVSYKFDKVHSDKNAYRFIIRTDVESLEGRVEWRKKGEEEWHTITLVPSELILSANIPAQKASTEIEYRAVLSRGEDTYILPPGGYVTMKFEGDVPSSVSGIFFLVLFGALLLSTRTGLEYFNENEKIKKLAMFTAALFFVYAIVFIPFIRTLKLGALNNFVPGITELFEIQPLILFVLWTAGTVLLFKLKNSKPVALIIAIMTLVVYLLVRV